MPHSSLRYNLAHEGNMFNMILDRALYLLLVKCIPCFPILSFHVIFAFVLFLLIFPLSQNTDCVIKLDPKDHDAWNCIETLVLSSFVLTLQCLGVYLPICIFYLCAPLVDTFEPTFLLSSACWLKCSCPFLLRICPGGTTTLQGCE